MAKNFCLLPDQIATLKKEMKVKGAKTIVSMSSVDRRKFFTDALGNKETGLELASSFEKAMSSKQQKALSNWAKTVFTEQEKKLKTYPDVISKINDLQKQGILSPTMTEDYLNSLIATSLGVDLKAEEVKKINELSEKIQETEKLEPDNQFFGYHSDYFKARKEMNDYINGIVPSSDLDLLFGIIGRGNLLASLKSPTTNVVSNLSSFITEPLVRRIIARKASGVNSDLILPFIKESYKIYKETGYDPVRMLKIQDEQKTLGEGRTSTEGKGALRKVARVYEDIVFKKLMGTPDILAAATHFGDALNILTTKVADQEGLTGEEHKKRARELFLKATQLKDVQDDTADLLRDAAIGNALYATFQQDSWYAKLAVQARDKINQLSGGLNLGTNLEPFIKTPANVIGAGLEYSGMTLPFTVANLAYNASKGNFEVTEQMSRQIVRAGLGLTVALIIAGLLDDDDYIPDYVIADAKQKQATKLSNATYNSIKIGDKWVSLDYFGVLGVMIAGIMGAKQEKTKTDKGISFVKNTYSQLRRLPFLSTLFDVGQWFDENKKYNKDAKDIIGDIEGNLASFAYSRSVPMIMSDIAKALDDKERYNDYNSFMDDIYAKIPFKRETLPAKFNDLGQIIPTENAFWTIFAGSRVKTANDDAAYKEIRKLSNEGEDFEITTKNFKEMKVAKSLLSPYEYNELLGQVQDSLRNAYLNTTETLEYKEADNEGKVELLRDVRRGVMEAVIENSPYSGRIENEIDRQKEEKDN